MDINELFTRNYQAVVNRGLIKPDTTSTDFYIKAKEELKEVFDAIQMEDKENEIEEWADLANVCLNRLIHLGIDPVEALTKTAIKNEGRAVNGTKKV